MKTRRSIQLAILIVGAYCNNIVSMHMYPTYDEEIPYASVAPNQQILMQSTKNSSYSNTSMHTYPTCYGEIPYAQVVTTQQTLTQPTQKPTYSRENIASNNTSMHAYPAYYEQVPCAQVVTTQQTLTQPTQKPTYSRENIASNTSMHTYSVYPDEIPFAKVITPQQVFTRPKKHICSCETTVRNTPILSTPKFFDFSTLTDLFSNDNFIQDSEGYYPYPNPTQNFLSLYIVCSEQKIQLYEQVFSSILAKNLAKADLLMDPIAKDAYFNLMIAKSICTKNDIKNENNAHSLPSFLKPNFYSFSKNNSASFPVSYDFYSYPEPANSFVCHDEYKKRFTNVFKYNALIATHHIKNCYPIQEDCTAKIKGYTELINAEKIIASYWLMAGKQNILIQNQRSGQENPLCE